MNSNLSQLNERADELFAKSEYSRALSEYQQIFLSGGKSQDAAVRAQVARALCGAARCYEQMRNPEMAAQIVQTLAKRYGEDADPKTRYWVELARGASTRGEPSPMIGEAQSDKTSKTDAEDSWEGFLEANDLGEETSEEQVAAPLALLPAANESLPSQWVSENEVSLEWLQQLFESAFLACESDGAMLRLQMDSSNFLVHLNEANNLIVCAALYGLRKYGDEGAKLQLANRLNSELVFVRFAIHDETTLVAQHSLSYAQGVSPFHIVNALRLMQRILTQSVAEYDTDDLLT